MNKEIYDVIIIGAGPGGLTAALYASRADLSVIFIEKGAPGGKMVVTDKVENWTGTKIIEGPALSLKMFAHAQEYGAKYKYGLVTDIKNISEFEHEVILDSKEIVKGKSVIIATGMVEKVPEQVENIRKFNNRGVSYCGICDGPLFKGMEVAVIGGGDSACEEGSYLASVASTVHMFIRSKIKATKAIAREIKAKSNVKFHFNSKILKINGEEKVESITALIDNQEVELPVKAVFPYIGQLPATEFLHEKKITDDHGFIITDENMETKIPGLYAIGDVRHKHIRQIITAANDGTIAAKMITNKL